MCCQKGKSLTYPTESYRIDAGVFHSTHSARSSQAVTPRSSRSVSDGNGNGNLWQCMAAIALIDFEEVMVHTIIWLSYDS